LHVRAKGGYDGTGLKQEDEMVTGLRIEVRDRVGVVTLANGDNAISGPFLAEIRDALEQLAQDDAVRAVVMTGEGKFFSNGLDLWWMKQQTPKAVLAFLVEVTQFLKYTLLFPKPIIGALNGHAFGMGAIWPCAFDFRVANSDRGWVCFPEMDIDIPFSPGMIATCVHGLGHRVFRDMAWTARRYPGAEAVAVGYARECAPESELVDTAVELAGMMANKGTVAFPMTKRAWAKEAVRVIDEEDPPDIAKIPLKLG
jgi:enoyl-CoA hydratase/carnithine racemase